MSLVEYVVNNDLYKWGHYRGDPNALCYYRIYPSNKSFILRHSSGHQVKTKLGQIWENRKWNKCVWIILFLLKFEKIEKWNKCMWIILFFAEFINQHIC